MIILRLLCIGICGISITLTVALTFKLLCDGHILIAVLFSLYWGIGNMFFLYQFDRVLEIEEDGQ